MNSPASLTWIDVDLEAYRRNIRVVRQRVAPAELMCVVKNNAYSNGLEQIVTVAQSEGIRFVGALDLDSALRLRAAGVPRDVRLFTWLLTPFDDLPAAVRSDIDLGISTIEQLEKVAAGGNGTRAQVHLKIDTGLNRNGARPEDWPALVARAAALQNAGLVEIVGVWTHISEASDVDDSASIAAFESALSIAREHGVNPRFRHLAASAASFAREDSRYDLVRVGAFTYGISPGDGITPASLGLDPVTALRAVVTELREENGITVALVPIGSGDGLMDMPCDGLTVSARGIRHPIRRINVTETVIDASSGLDRGDIVTLLGSDTRGEPTLQEWADALGTIGEEVVTRLSPRIERRYGGA